jgi:hypothetical protein
MVFGKELMTVALKGQKKDSLSVGSMGRWLD